MTTGPVGFEPSLQALQPGGGPAAVQRREGGGRRRNSGGGSEGLTGVFSQLRQPFAAILAGLSSSPPPLQTPRGLNQQQHRKSGAVVVNSCGGGGKTLGGHNRRLRPPNEVVPTPNNSCELPLQDPIGFSKLWLRFDRPPCHYPNRQ